MNELIILKEQDGKTVVSARDLYDYLEPKTEFAKWCTRMFTYGFEEGIAFSSIMTASTGGRPSTDYALTLDCAKEIAMVQWTEKGKAAREYFIAI